MAKKSRVSYRKHGGDDKYSWSVFIDGIEKWSGMDQREAKWRAERERQELGEKTP